MAVKRATSSESALTKNQIIAQLTRSSHGNLADYVPVGKQAVKTEPEFFAHLAVWNAEKGQVRDSKAALPVILLSDPRCQEQEFIESSLALLTRLNPRELLKAFRFAKSFGKAGATDGPSHRMLTIRRLTQAYLQVLEKRGKAWESVAFQHRNVLKELYTLIRLKPEARAKQILFERKYPDGSIFQMVKLLPKMSPQEAAGTILEKKIPFLVARGALGKRINEPDIALALINRMSPTELVTSTQLIDGMGVKKNPALRSAYEEALKRAGKSKKTSLKATRAAEAVKDEGLKDKLKGLQEKQLQSLAVVEGNWLVLGDKSGSMNSAIETARLISATLVRMVKGKVSLVFFDVAPRFVDATGMSYDQLKEATRHVEAQGGTSIGCGVRYAIDNQVEVDGIAIVSDGGENRAPVFAHEYKELCKLLGKDVPIYFYRLSGESDVLTASLRREEIDVQEFDLTEVTVDYYSLPNLVQTMRTNRYGLVDEIMNTPLLKLGEEYKPLMLVRAGA